MNLKKYIPNAITCFNLFFGCLACVMAFKGNYVSAAIFIYIAAVCDFFDGFAARLLKAYSNIGKELDSLADCVSFGMAPGLIMFSLLQDAHYPTIFNPIADYIPYIAFAITIFSALRLAKFNVDERQTTSFIGLPTPANAIFMASLASSLPVFFLKYGLVLVLIVLLFSYLLVSEIPMFSLKIKNLKLKENILPLTLIFLSAIILIIGGFEFLYLIIILYIALSILALLTPNPLKRV
jgi:CDP-diacylglycerol--serine O-phosphatidyltransferase